MSTSNIPVETPYPLIPLPRVFIPASKISVAFTAIDGNIVAILGNFAFVSINYRKVWGSYGTRVPLSISSMVQKCRSTLVLLGVEAHQVLLI